MSSAELPRRLATEPPAPAVSPAHDTAAAAVASAPPASPTSSSATPNDEGTAGRSKRAQPTGTDAVETPRAPAACAAPAASRARSSSLDDTALSTPNDREATELASVRSRRSGRQCPSEAPTAADTDEAEARRCRLKRQRIRWYDAVQRWWRRQVSVTVEAAGMRDHLALERTFLGYMRTSIALSITGVVMAQLFRLQHAPHPDPRLGYYVLGTPLAAAFILSAMAVALLGAFRFWRQQNAIVRGKVHAGGWEILTIMAGALALTTVVFVLLVAVDVRKG